MVKVAVLDDYQNVASGLTDWSRLPQGSEVKFYREHLTTEDACARELQPFDVIVGMRERTPFRRSLLERLPNLKLLITTGPRNASFDVAAATERGIVICGTGGGGTPPAGVASTAEITWGLILDLVRNITFEDRVIRNGGWQEKLGPTVTGLTLGLLGLGNLGSQVATIGKAFGMDLIAWSQNLTAERAAQIGARLVSKDELMAQADVLSVHVVLSDRTRGLVGARELALMKPTAYLINTSRGPIVDEAALVEALRSNRIAGAGLDVFDVEPLPADHPFRSLPNTVLTPHIGYVNEPAYQIWFDDIVENILAFLDGKPVRVVTAGGAR